MIPMILTESTVTPAVGEAPTAKAPDGKTLPLFADMFLLGDTDPALLTADQVAILPDGVNMPEVALDEVLVQTAPDGRAKVDDAETLAVTAVQTNAAPTKQGAPGSGLQEPNKPVENVPQGLPKASADRAGGKDVMAAPGRPSIAQSAIESQLPKTSPILAKPEVDGVLLQEPKAKPLEIAREIVGPAARAAQPTTQSLPTAAVVPETPLADQGLPRKSREHNVEVARPKPTTTPQIGGSIAQSNQPPAVILANAPHVSKPQPSEGLSRPVEAEPSVGLNGGERNVSVSSVTGQITPAAGAETARHAATQIAVAVTNHPNKATEIALNPEELGRVRLSITANEGTITLHVSTERPETQDLLRRHIDVLAQEFRELGYDTISFSFGKDGQDPADQSDDLEDDRLDPEMGETRPTSENKSMGPSSGLDLRL